MCGLCGMAGYGIGKDDLDLFEQLLYITALRGFDSTGLMTAKIHSGKQKVKVEKMVGPSIDFIRADKTKPYAERMLNDLTQDVFLGHCRYATVGKVTKDNSHPFKVGNLIGAHNGTLVGKEWNDDKEKTDSQIMFEAMDREGIIPVLRRLLFGSAFAVSIYDEANKKLYLGRNSERPLWIGRNKKHAVHYWASEYRMLSFVANRGGIEMDIDMVEKDTLIEIDVAKISPSKKSWTIHDVSRIKTVDTKLWDEWESRQSFDKKSNTPLSSGSLQGAPWYEGDGDECIVCGDPMTSDDCKKHGGVLVDGQTYYCCSRCDNVSIPGVQVG